MLGDISKWPIGTLILVPSDVTGAPEVVVGGRFYIPLTPPQFAASLEPQLPAVGSVWRTKDGKHWAVEELECDGNGRRMWPLCSGVSTQFVDLGNFPAWHSQWVRDHGAVCVFSPEKEPPCPSK